jgi:hypothetical protein
VFGLLDVQATITEHDDQTKIRLQGSVAPDLLLAGVRDNLAPGKLATDRDLGDGPAHTNAGQPPRPGR